MVKIAIISYSTYGHVLTLAKSIQKGIEKSGGEADIFQVEETLSDDVLALIHAPAKPADIPYITPEILQNYDGFLFGIPTRFGNLPAQWSAFWEKTGKQWAQGSFHGKIAGIFVSTGTPGGGQETTIRNILSILTHHGIIYVPLGYGKAFPLLTSLDEVHGGSPWGSGTFAGGDGSRQPSKLELDIGEIQGESFYNTVQKIVASKQASKSNSTAKQTSQGTGATTTGATAAATSGAAATATGNTKDTTGATATKDSKKAPESKEQVVRKQQAQPSKEESKSEGGVCAKCIVM
ncbi:hypothetical protein BN7_4219 [Wickerhamomyces ciferrii]|uniref:Flavodoxin-like domain-containing protein n=1 Tax=Wickerhamomyces ciferrii (strain ATCC 14091 / BCRC 22168 / CBS 111 / JCM 3599 / NBRC 0793 / NRRL Y-1031 F-60-10) TaxID=1206466 RepID=K0KHF4_WICCF|nr:uncharacterized protein BN7_4219 [Wickerhamomyces ciferrii]CCH44650.1 hypothetical protein BN7_4219 [Wickerhamomyces ciferrii]